MVTFKVRKSVLESVEHTDRRRLIHMSVVVSHLNESSLANCARGKENDLDIKKEEIKCTCSRKYIFLWCRVKKDKKETFGHYWSLDFFS